jgi:hypothetical protein
MGSRNRKSVRIVDGSVRRQSCDLCYFFASGATGAGQGVRSSGVPQ